MLNYPLNPASLNDEIKINQNINHKKTMKTNPPKISSLNTIVSNIHNKSDDDDNDDNNYLHRKNLLINEEEFNKSLNQDLKIDKSINIEKPNIDKLNQNNPNSYTEVNNIYSNYENSYNNQLYRYNNNNINNNNQNNSLTNKQLLDKLNYVIHLLEEQHNEKTNYLTEELILYLFLGIFIIFVLDSFTKASKYIR